MTVGGTVQWLLGTAEPFLNHVGWDLRLGKTMAVCVRGQDVAGVEERTQKPARIGLPWACIGLLSAQVHIQDSGKALREAWREGKRKEKKRGSTILSDLSRLTRLGMQPGMLSSLLPHVTCLPHGSITLLVLSWQNSQEMDGNEPVSLVWSLYGSWEHLILLQAGCPGTVLGFSLVCRQCS